VQAFYIFNSFNILLEVGIQDWAGILHVGLHCSQIHEFQKQFCISIGIELTV